MRSLAVASVLALFVMLARGASAADWTYVSDAPYGASSCAGGGCCGWGFGCCENPVPRYDYLWSNYCGQRARIWSWWHSRPSRHCAPACGSVYTPHHMPAGVMYR